MTTKRKTTKTTPAQGTRPAPHPGDAAEHETAAVFVGGPLDGRRIAKGGVGQWATYRDLTGQAVWAEAGDARLRRGEQLYMIVARDSRAHTDRVKPESRDRVYRLAEQAAATPETTSAP